MDFEAVGLYWFLLSREWQTGYLTADENVLQRLAAGRVRDWHSAWKQVRPCFEERDGKLYNARLEAERAIADQFSMRQSGKAKARWDRFKATTPCPGNAAAMPRHSHGNASAMPRTGQDKTGQDGTTPLSPPRGAKTRKARIDPATIDLPAKINYADVRAALTDYLATRKGGAWDEKLAAVRLKQLDEWGRERAIAALRHSVGYQGLFEPSTPKNGRPIPPPLEASPYRPL